MREERLDRVPQLRAGPCLIKPGIQQAGRPGRLHEQVQHVFPESVAAPVGAIHETRDLSNCVAAPDEVGV